MLNNTMFRAFVDELEKQAGVGVGMELAGLGLLAAPAAKHLATGKEMKNKNKSRLEMAGLGTLAAGTLAHMAKKAASLWHPDSDNVSDIRAKTPTPTAPLKSAANIRGSKIPGSTGPSATAVAKPATVPSLMPKMAPLGKVTGGAPVASKAGLIGRTLGKIKGF